MWPNAADLGRMYERRSAMFCCVLYARLAPFYFRRNGGTTHKSGEKHRAAWLAIHSGVGGMHTQALLECAACRWKSTDGEKKSMAWSRAEIFMLLHTNRNHIQSTLARIVVGVCEQTVERARSGHEVKHKFERQRPRETSAVADIQNG